MSAGRPPTTVEGQVRAVVRRLADRRMEPDIRADVMAALLSNARADLVHTGRPSRDVLVRLAAHAIVWADEERSP